MALKRLPNDVQSLLCATAQVNTLKRAVEELVHNSLDAKSTSIAIRIHIQENNIQVIDNGIGITKHDFIAVGQRYMTSKITDISTLKAAPKNYGYRGEFLANVITVSQMVKITSRHESTEETWAKSFHNGKEKKFAKMSTRPTKGTTVDIKGFLYNLNIQKKRMDRINEMQNIKLFLEQLSLVHNNISLSLRDDSKNDIVFKIHKKRDIYQTLSTLFDIDKADVIELQVEKNEYKVKGFIKKTDKDFAMHWIYLNGKFIHSSSKLHNIVNKYFMKLLLIRDQRKNKSKKNNDEHQLFNQDVPFYFIFIICPYIDYDISFTPIQSTIEFKNWDQINKLLEKLVKFYVGDVNLKELKKPESKSLNKEQTNIKSDQDTRDQVKEIINKILGSNSKKFGVSQLQNGVKGKMVKRKIKKKIVKKTTLPLLFQNKNSCNDEGSFKSNVEPSFEHNAERHIQTLDSYIDKQQKLEISKNFNNNREVSHPKRYKLKENLLPKKKIKEIKVKNLPKREKHKTLIKHKHIQRLNKHKNLNVNNKLKILKQLKETDSVYKRSKLVAQQAEAFLQQTRKRKANIALAQKAHRKNNKNIILQKYNDDDYIDNNIAMPPKINSSIIAKYIQNKLKTNSYQTTYDLVQTIQISQQGMNAKKILPEPCYKEIHYRNRRHDTFHCMTKTQKRSIWENKYTFGEYSDIGGKQEILQYAASIPIYEYEDNFRKYSSAYEHKKISDFIPSFSETTGFIQNKNYNQNYNFSQKEASYLTINRPLNLLTYNSHQYYRNKVFESQVNSNSYTIQKQQNMRFITKQSRDNFVNSLNLTPKFKRSSKSIINKKSNIFDKCMRQNTDEQSYTIDYFQSNEKYCDITHNDILGISVGCKENDLFKNKTNIDCSNEILVNELNSIFGNTYTIQPTNFSSAINNVTQNQTKPQYVKSRELFNTYSIHYSNSEINNDIISKTLTEGEYTRSKENFNIVFVSKPQCRETESTIDNNIEPLNVCETILHDSGTIGREFAFSFNENNQLNDSLYDNFGNISGINEGIENGPFQMTTHQKEDITENVSHHFNISVTKHPNVIDNNINDTLQHPMPIQTSDKDNRNEVYRAKDLPYPHVEGNFNIDNKDCNIEINQFNFKNRLRFVPKGMSQIFENCRSKTACHYNLDNDYYEDSIYNNFANDVQVNGEIYEPIIQNVEDLTTKNIHKFQNKVKKDHASLVFDEKSLKEAKVLGQVDCKFIAAIMKKRSHESEHTEYLLLFDQHAVHERIRLERNLKDYIYEDKWTSVPLDNIIMKMSKDEILYLHNYKDKFSQLGLQWTILNDNEVNVNSIPGAILGKNSREVEKVIKAVRNLIVEEINVIKLQKGCFSLYPKSIMDLVFSEACRYAIKFGDHLSKNDCIELLNALSDCNTPFQCAHGRPVMAVIIDIKNYKREYKINMEKLNRFKPRNTTNL